jgi:hypothetical protein
LLFRITPLLHGKTSKLTNLNTSQAPPALKLFFQENKIIG